MPTLSGCTGTITTTQPTTQPGYSPSSPAQVGVVLKDIIACGVGYTSYELYDINVTLLEVVRGNEAWELIKAASVSNEPPGFGFEYVLARIRFEYFARGAPGDCCHQLMVTQFIAFSADGKQYEAASVVLPNPELSGRLCSGDSLEGWVAFQVAQDESKPLMTFNAGIGGAEAVEYGGNIWFQLY